MILGPMSLARVSGQLLALLAAALLLLSACAEAPDGNQRLLADRPAATELSRIRKSLTEGTPLPPADYQWLRELLARHPDAELVRTSYQAALIQRADWAALEEFLLETPAASRSAEDQRNLLNVYYRQGKYEQLLEAAQTLPADALTLELEELLATGEFRLGRLEQAAARLDRRWQEISAAQRAPSISLRGQIHQRLGELAQARELLGRALQLAPTDRTTLLALSRLHYAAGELEQAELLRLQADAVQAQLTAQEQRAMRQVSLVNGLKADWAAQRYLQVIAQARAALEIADPALRPVLYEYIAESHQRLGQPEQARAALAEAQRVPP
jgi:tetratricopeptide (TPR) repeat protein